MKTTLEDVAKAAGVSKSLVSKCLAGAPDARMRVETRKRIEEAVRKCHYLPSRLAQSLKKGRSRTIGLVISDLRNPFWAALADFALREAEKSHYRLLISLCEFCPQEELEHLRALLFKLREMGLLVQEDARGLCLRGQVRHGADIRTLSYPGFPTDLQAPMMTVACAARGRSVFLETIFENRYMHAISLCRMGADIRTEGRMAVVEGGKPLSGAVVEATDLRAGAALMLAGLIAQGETTLLDEPGHICRGYEGLDEKLRALGADVTIAPLH